jgi:hypothetical protein
MMINELLANHGEGGFEFEGSEIENQFLFTT